MQVTRSHDGPEESAVRRWAPLLFELNPVRIALIYLVLGFAALYVSDVLLGRFVADPLLADVQAIKGGVEVVLTGGLVYGLTAAHRAQMGETEEKFERQRQELLVLHRVLRHNLRNDLNVIFGHSRTLADVLSGREDRSRCDVIQRKAEDILHYTEQAERIRRVSEGGGSTIEVDLATELPEIVSNHPLVTDDVEVGYDLPESAQVRVNRMFPEAIEEVVANAVENSEGPGASIDVTVDAGGGGLTQTEVRIDDDGPGIPDHVPEILAQSEYDQLAHLQGMGIWFVYWVVVESQGELFIEESPKGGARIVMRFPRANVVSTPGAIPSAGEVTPA